MTSSARLASLSSDPQRRPHGIISLVLRVVLAFLVIVPASIVLMVVSLLLIPSRRLRIQAGNVYGKVIGPTVFRLAGARPVFSNREGFADASPAIFVSNHSSTIDMWIGMWLCPYRGCGTAKKEIQRIPFFGQAYLLSGHLLLDRGNRERAIKSMAKAAEVIHKHRLSVWMWPEGTRSKDGRLRPLKKGFVHLALATRLPVVPVVFHHADHVWPGRTWKVTPGDIKIDVLEPIDTTNWSADTVQEHAIEVWSAFQNSLDPDQRTPDEDVPVA